MIWLIWIVIVYIIIGVVVGIIKRSFKKGCFWIFYLFEDIDIDFPAAKDSADFDFDDFDFD